VNPSPTILCVDDEANALFARKAILELNGYQVLTASTAEQGLSTAACSDIDLVISDHFLIGSTGCELARRIKELKPDVPFILLSGATELPEDAIHANVFLSKLEGPERMLKVIRELLRGKVRQAVA
jgi:DNA-binding NtrC family response regulator